MIYRMVIHSIAPTIYGNEDVKEAITLQLFGGIAKEMPGRDPPAGGYPCAPDRRPGYRKEPVASVRREVLAACDLHERPVLDLCRSHGDGSQGRVRGRALDP